MTISYSQHIKTLHKDIEKSLNFYETFLNKKQKEIFLDKSPLKIIQGIRQSGKSRIIKFAAIFSAMFEPNRSICVVTQNIQNSKCFLDDLKQMYMDLPPSESDKPAITRWNSNRISFENGSTIFMTSAYNVDSLPGLQFDTILMDEIAFVQNSQMSLFFSVAYRSISKASQVIIASTRNTRSKKNLFWNLWCDAVDGINGFKPFAISRKDVPNLDYKRIKASIGERKYENEFIIKKAPKK